jgi:hypothetical protein
MCVRTPDPQRRRVPGYGSDPSWGLAGVDMRSIEAKRFVRDCRAVAGEIGPGIGEIGRGLVRQFVANRLHSQAVEAAIVKGETVNTDEIIRLSSESRRLMEALLSLKVQHKTGPQPTIRERITAQRT